jgi:hypothetical protein
MWPSLSSATEVVGPRTEVVMNIDPTNQAAVPNDAGGWSGFAAIRVGDEKLVLGWPGIPDDWCWPNQNKSHSLEAHSHSHSHAAAAATDEQRACRGEGTAEGPHGEGGWLDLSVAQLVEGQETEDSSVTKCSTPPGSGEAGAACCLTGSQNKDLRHFKATAADACCTACGQDPKCVGYTFNHAGQECWLKATTGDCTVRLSLPISSSPVHTVARLFSQLAMIVDRRAVDEYTHRPAVAVPRL